MLRGYTVPLSPLGQANLAPPPLWHYSRDVLAAESRAVIVGMSYSVTDLKILEDFAAQ